MKIIKIKNKITGEEKDIQIPDGFEYDETITCDKYFKYYDGSYEIHGYYIAQGRVSKLNEFTLNTSSNKDVFTTKELAESAIALAQLSQIIEHDTKLSNLHVDKEDVLNINFLKVLRKHHSIHHVVTVEYNYDKKCIDCISIELETYTPFDSIIINDLFLRHNNYLIFLTVVNSEIEIIKDFIKDNENLIRKYLMV